MTIVVEADGHKWHERTKAQAASGAKRDRFLVAAGWRVTGSEIFKNPSACAREVKEAMETLRAG